MIAAIRTSTLLPATRVSDDEMLDWVNEGYFRLAVLHGWPWLEAAGHFHATVGQQDYPLTDIDASARRLIAVYDDESNRRLRQVAPAVAINEYGDEFPSAERATCFFVWADRIYLIPVPTAVTMIYKVLYHKAPAALLVGTSPEFDPMFHHCLVHYGEFRAWQLEEDLDKAAAAYSHYADMVERMRMWYTQRVDDDPWAVGSPSGSARSSNTPFLDGL